MAVHDEIVVESDTQYLEQAESWLREAMIDGMAPLTEPVPVKVETAVGTTWASD
jgi:DNA polymerase I-like protein with 3'-5' exonuclease and polymerase domains